MELQGEKKLKENMGIVRESKVKKITDKVYFFNYYGSSNATMVIGENSVILIDALDADYYAQIVKAEIEKITDKPVKTIIYTHQHADHIGGAEVFSQTVEKVIAHTSNTPIYGKTNLLGDILKDRLIKQFGYKLTIEEALSSGLGPAIEAKGKNTPLAPTYFVDKEQEKFIIDGIEIVLLSAPGETDDQQYVWLPQEKVVCSGDNYYASWPNLYAIRGSQYRDVSCWVNSLDILLNLNSEFLLPGHGEALLGAKEVESIIKPYREGINYVLEETLKGMNKGLTPDELVNSIKLPAHLAMLPQLQEYYGTIEWSIRGIYSGYFGWFDGNPTHLGTMKVQEKAEKQIKMMGGADNILNEIAAAIEKQEMQWACELCDILLAAHIKEKEARKYKAQCLLFLGRMQTSANGRHYYLTVAKELME